MYKKIKDYSIKLFNGIEALIGGYFTSNLFFIHLKTQLICIAIALHSNSFFAVMYVLK